MRTAEAFAAIIELERLMDKADMSHVYYSGMISTETVRHALHLIRAALTKQEVV